MKKDNTFFKQHAIELTGGIIFIIQAIIYLFVPVMKWNKSVLSSFMGDLGSEIDKYLGSSMFENTIINELGMTVNQVFKLTFLRLKNIGTIMKQQLPMTNLRTGIVLLVILITILVIASFVLTLPVLKKYYKFNLITASVSTGLVIVLFLYIKTSTLGFLKVSFGGILFALLCIAQIVVYIVYKKKGFELCRADNMKLEDMKQAFQQMDTSKVNDVVAGGMQNIANSLGNAAASLQNKNNEAKKICPQCNAEASAQAKFCASCGYAFPKEEKKPCISCGEILNPESKFCKYCGARQPDADVQSGNYGSAE